jgi:hypothetical protein
MEVKQMTNIRDDEFDAAHGEGDAVVQTEAAGEQPALAESTAADDGEKKGSRKRKTPKHSKTKKETAAETDTGAGALGGSTETAERSKDEQAKPDKPSDDVLASYPNLAAWPASAGPAPLSAHILTAPALGMGAGTKRELAVAAYLRDEAGQFTLVQVAEALRAVLGGEFNVQRNVVKGLEADGLAKLSKVTTEGVGTSFRLELTPQGQDKVNRWLAALGHSDVGLCR